MSILARVFLYFPTHSSVSDSDLASQSLIEAVPMAGTVLRVSSRMFCFFYLTRAVLMLRLLALWRDFALQLPSTIKELYWLLLVLFISLYMFALGGMHLFGHVVLPSTIPDYQRFDTFVHALLSCFQLYTAANWGSLAETYMAALNGSSTWWYFVVFYLWIQYSVGNLVAATIYDKFAAISSREDGSDGANEVAQDDSSTEDNAAEAKSEVDVQMSGGARLLRWVDYLCSPWSVNVSQTRRSGAPQSVQQAPVVTVPASAEMNEDAFGALVMTKHTPAAPLSSPGPSESQASIQGPDAASPVSEHSTPHQDHIEQLHPRGRAASDMSPVNAIAPSSSNSTEHVKGGYQVSALAAASSPANIVSSARGGRNSASGSFFPTPPSGTSLHHTGPMNPSAQRTDNAKRSGNAQSGRDKYRTLPARTQPGPSSSSAAGSASAVSGARRHLRYGTNASTGTPHSDSSKVPTFAENCDFQQADREFASIAQSNPLQAVASKKSVSSDNGSNSNVSE